MTITRRLWIVAVPLVAILAAWAVPGKSKPPAQVKMEDLYRAALDSIFTPDREVIVTYVEIPPNTTLDRHWHPGEEFHYCLEGEARIEIEGGPPVIDRPGQVGHVPYRKVHTAIAGKDGAKILVFRVHTKGEPVRFLEKGGHEEH